jgi:predicted transcriptional regulator
MKLSEVVKILSCEVFCCESEINAVVAYGCASDLMSDVLAFSKTGALLLTGLVNAQTVHTAFIAEIKAIVFVRGKKPDKELVNMAREKRIPLLGTPYSMYEASGILYQTGLVSTMEPIMTKSPDE